MAETIFRGYDGAVLRVSLITGHATASTLTGITTSDQLMFVGHFSTAANLATLVDFTASSSVSAADTVAWASTTANDHMEVWWWDVEPANTGTTTPPLDMSYSSGGRYCIALADGAADGVLTVSGINTACKLIYARLQQTKAAIATVTNDTANCSITDTDEVTSATDSTDDQYLVVWFDPEPAATVNSYNSDAKPRIKLGDGAAANTNITISGITTDDEIIASIEYATKASIATCTDRTSEASITSDGYIQHSTTSTANDLIQCFYYDLNEA